MDHQTVRALQDELRRDLIPLATVPVAVVGFLIALIAPDDPPPSLSTLGLMLMVTAIVQRSQPSMLPSEFRWGNYAQTVSMVPFGRWVYNTIVITCLATLGTVLTSSLVAYSFACFTYRFKDALFLVTLGTMMMPAQVTLIPRFIMFFKFGEWTGLQFLNTWRPLWIPAWFGGGAFSIFLMRQFIQTIPRDFDEAALIDGASYLCIFWRIVMPLCKPVIATLAIISGIGQWNSFIEPMIYLNESSRFPISVGLHYFRETAGGMTEEPKEHLLMCGSVLTTLPPIIVFFLFQEYFVQGVVMSGIKG